MTIHRIPDKEESNHVAALASATINLKKNLISSS